MWVRYSFLGTNYYFWRGTLSVKNNIIYSLWEHFSLYFPSFSFFFSLFFFILFFILPLFSLTLIFIFFNFSLLFLFSSSITKLSLIPSPTIIPLLVVIDLQCSLGFVYVLVENWPLCCSANCLAIYPTCVSKFLIEPSVFLWDKDACINFSKVSSNLLVLSWTEG